MIEYLTKICFDSATKENTGNDLNHYWCKNKAGENVLFLGNTDEKLHIFTDTEDIAIKSISHINSILGIGERPKQDK